MNHSHVLYDADPHFKINASTRVITNESGKTKLVQYDHNSERFTFDAPRVIEGHDLSECNCVEIHYLNIEANSKKVKSGVYTVTDLKVSDEDADTVVFSWLIGDGATQLIGQLNFLVRFSCVVESTGEIEYAWNTAIHVGTMISTGIYNSGTIVEENIEPLKAWKADLDATQIKKIEQTTVSDADGGTNVWTATFGDGRTQELIVKNGSKGSTGLVGSIETVDGNPLNFFYGTQAQYEALTHEQKADLFAIITDDGTDEKLQSALEYFEGLIEGTTKVKAAETADALSSPLYMATVKATGKTASGEGIEFYFSFITAKKAAAQNVGSLNDILPDYEVPASGFFGENDHVCAVKKASGNGIRFLTSPNVWYESLTSINPGYSLTLTINYKLLTGGEV